MSETITVDAADLRAQIRAVEQAVAAAAEQLDGSIARADGTVAALEEASKRPARAGSDGDAADRLAKARRNAARLRQEGGAALSALRREAEPVLDSLRRRLKLVEEKLSARH